MAFQSGTGRIYSLFPCGITLCLFHNLIAPFTDNQYGTIPFPSYYLLIVQPSDLNGHLSVFSTWYSPEYPKNTFM